MAVLKFVTHSKKIINISRKFGWLPGARYTNLRDVKTFNYLGFLDIDWKNYNFNRHLEAVKATCPYMTVARDIEDVKNLDQTIEQAYMLARYSKKVIVVPKDIRLSEKLNDLIPELFILGYSVPSKYGGTRIPPRFFKRPVHLLGGRPDTQRRIGELMPVFSIDCNRFTYDARFGDYFDGQTFRPHPVGGYERCVHDSIRNITMLWKTYDIDNIIKYKVVN
ncbi:MAG: hypothetical protein PHY02_06645 [Phycisphaerae bacterium]|nr:hypothetical protein [Phycisphaerae bacterium]